MDVYEYYFVLKAMKTKADKFDLRLKMIIYACKESIKAASRAFGTTPKTIRNCLFARILCEHLENCGVDMNKFKFQLENLEGIKDFHRRVAAEKDSYFART